MQLGEYKRNFKIFLPIIYLHTHTIQAMAECIDPSRFTSVCHVLNVKGWLYW